MRVLILEMFRQRWLKSFLGHHPLDKTQLKAAAAAPWKEGGAQARTTAETMKAARMLCPF